MEKADENLLRKNHMELRKNMAPQITHVLEYLESTNIITDDMRERIDCENKTPGDKASKLLYLIRTRGKHAFQALYDATISAGLFSAADILKPENAPHQPQYSPPQGGSSLHGSPDEESEEEDLPDRWPLEDETELRKKVKVKSFEDSKMKKKLQKEYDNAISISQRKYYPLTHRNRGFCLIINNEKFKYLDDRYGTSKDVADLNALFTGLGFYDCHVEKDLECEDMKECIRTKVLNCDHSNSDCFVLVILSHGAEGVVFGTDGRFEEITDKPINGLDLRWIKESVCAVQSLRDKPKLFFIQACRGKNHDKGQPDGSSMNKGDSSDPEKGTGETNPDSGGPDNHQSREKPEDEVDARGEIIPTLSDVYQSFSTSEGHVSYRNTKFGTWYVQALVWVLSRFAYRDDIHGLMTKVANLVSKAEIEKSGWKQIPDTGGSLRRNFRFFPKLSK